MPDPFQPRFVDLVRNLTTTTGTGNFVLGAAVAGHASFASAIEAGESFYYSVIGVEKPAEREVGRGTMQANGTISRDAIDGTLTNFTPGIKTIALIAPASWFNSVQAALGSGGGGGSGVATRAALALLESQSSPMILQESGREGLFHFSSSNLSAKVAADTLQGIYVAPASAPTGASGAWVRQFSGGVDVRWFGYVADNVTDNHAAISGALAFMVATQPAGDAFNCPNNALLFPPGRGFCSQTVNIKGTVRLMGLGTGLAGGMISQVRFAANKHGFVVNRHTSLGDAEITPTTAADGSIIEGLGIIGGGGAGLTHHGIYMRARAKVRDCQISGFAGHGIAILADETGTADAPLGNANGWRVEDCRSYENHGDGLRVAGNNANVGMCSGGDFSGNGGWGFRDMTGVGNTYGACHTDFNGFTNYSSLGVSLCAYPTPTSQRYCVVAGQAVAASTTQPGTNPAVWHAIPGVSSATLWVSGMTWREGGAFRTTGVPHLISNCYSEGGQGVPQCGDNAVLELGTYPNGVLAGTRLHTAAGNLSTNRGYEVVQSGGLTARLGGNEANGDVLYADKSGGTAFRLRYEGPDFVWTYGGNVIARVTWTSTTLFFGRSAAQPEKWAFPEVFLGSNNEARAITYADAAPTSGSHAAGELVFNFTGGTPFGWYCTASGTPGTWVALPGNIIAETVTVSGAASGIHINSRDTGAGWQQFNSGGTLGFHNGTTKLTLSSAGNLAAAGTVLGSNLSGTNSGDQTITLTGDVTGAGTGSFAATIGANKVTYAKLQNVSATALLLGRATAGAGMVEEVPLANGLAMTGGALGMGAITPASVVTAGALASTGTAGNGYAAGAGGTITQSPNKSSSVTLNKICGRVTMNNASLATSASVSFTLNNTTIAATDVVLINIASAGAANSYFVNVDAVAAGSCRIHVRNVSAGALGEALVLNFAVIKSVIA